MLRVYRLIGKRVEMLNTLDIIGFLKYREPPQKRLWHTWISRGSDPLLVSTFFIGLDRSFGRTEEPLLFETCVLGARLEAPQFLCSSYDQAKVQHDAVCELCAIETRQFRLLTHESNPAYALNI